MEFEIIEAKSKAKFCVIWLHGLGADGHDFAGITKHINTLKDDVRFIFPHADILPITINMGMEMRGWYDIKSLDANSLNRIVDIEGIKKSIAKINKLINQQIEQGILAENIILAGFSQGGVIAAYTMLTSQRKLAGVMALSTYFPAWDEFKKQACNINKDIPILVCHGTHDPVLPEILGQDLSSKLQDLGFKCDYKSYQGMEHNVCSEEIVDISKFINKTLYER